MRKIPVPIVYVGLLLGWLLSGSAAAQDTAQLDALRGSYTEAMESLKQQLVASLDGVKVAYLRELAVLEASVASPDQAAVRRERARAAVHAYILDDAVVDEPGSLRRLQRVYQARFAASAYETCQRITLLSDRYAEVLARLAQSRPSEKTKTIAEEAERARQNTMVVVARALSERHRNPVEIPVVPPADPAPPAPPPSIAPPEPEPAPNQPEEGAGEVRPPIKTAWRIYSPGSEPAQKLKTESQGHTGMHSRAAVGQFQIEVATYTEEARLRRESEFGDNYSRGGVQRQVPRLRLRYIGRLPVEGAKLVIQYFVRGGGSNAPKHHYTEHIPLPRMVQQDSLVVDASGVRQRIYETFYRKRRESSTTSPSDVSGMILSVHGPDGALLYQQSTQSVLNDFSGPEPAPASPEPPLWAPE